MNTITSTPKTMTWTGRGLLVSYGTNCSFLADHMDTSLDFSTDGASSLSPDGSLLAVRESDGMVRVRRVVFDEWRLGDVQFTCQQLARADILHFAWSSESDMLAVQLSDGSCSFFMTTSGWQSRIGQQRNVYRFGNPLPRPAAMAFAPEGLRIVLANPTGGGSVLWDAQRGTLVRTLDTGTARSVCWSPSRTFVAAGGEDSSVSICSARNGRVLRTLTGHTARVSALCWSPNDSRLISGDQDGNLQVWDSSHLAPSEWHPLSLPASMQPMKGGIQALVCSPDGGRIAVLDSTDVLDTFFLD